MAKGSKPNNIKPWSLKGLTFIALIVLIPFLALELGIWLFWNQDISTVVKVGPAYEFTEEGYHRYRVGARWIDRTPEFEIEYEIGAQGLRDQTVHSSSDKEESPKKGRFLFLGDSFTFGAANQYSTTYLYYLEQNLKRSKYSTEIVKAGVSRYNQYLEYKYLVDLWERFPSEYVVVGFLPNDLFDNRPLAWKYDLAEVGSLTTSKKDKGRSLHILKLAKSMILHVDSLYVSLYEKTGRGRIFGLEQNLDDEVSSQIEITKGLFSDFHRFCQERGAKFVVLSIPQLYQILKDQDSEFSSEELDRIGAGYARDNGFEWIETLGELKRASRENGVTTHFRIDGHLTPEGNKIVAGRLFAVFQGWLGEDETGKGHGE